MERIKHHILIALLVLCGIFFLKQDLLVYAESSADEDVGYSVKDVTDYSKQTKKKDDSADLDTMSDDSVKDSGTLGDNITWELSEDGVLTISGSGAMETNAYKSDTNYTTEGVPWYSYASDIKEVEVGEGITYLGDASFLNCKNLTKVSLPSTLKTIGCWAFYECTSLPEVDIPDSVTEIKLASFIETAITEIKIPEGVTEIGIYAFQECTALKKITLPDSLTAIREGAFNYCSKLTGILELPDNLITLSDNAFRKTSYAGVKFGSKVETIGAQVFYNDSNFSSVTFLGSCPEISSTAFSNQTIIAYYPSSDSSWTEDKLTDYGGTITWKEFDGNTLAEGIDGDDISWKIDWEGTMTISGSGDMPSNSSTTGTPWHGFKDVVKEIVIENGITNLTKYAFYEFSRLEKVSLPDTVTTVNDYAFKGCTSLTNAEFLNKVTALGDNVFENCTALKHATLPEGITIINSYLFENCISLEDIVIPDNVTKINYKAFYNCKSLKKLVLGAGISSITYTSFIGCSSLTSFEVSENNTKYTSVDGYLCDSGKTSLCLVPPGLTDIEIPSGIKTINAEAIYNNTNFEKVTIPASVAYINSPNLSNCSKLSDITVDSANTSFVMQDNMLYNTAKTTLYASVSTDSDLTASDFPSTLTQIRGYVFYYNKVLTSVELPNSVKGIGISAFEHCEALRSITLSEALNTISEYAFMYCYSLSSIVIPDSVTSMGTWAFGDCTKLKNLTLGTGLTTLPSGAFMDCSSLTKVIIPKTVTTCSYTPFNRCSDLETLVFLGDSPELANQLISSTMETRIYYPSDNSTWDGIEASSFGDAAILCPYSDGDYESAIYQDCIAVSGGWSKEGCYEISSSLLTYTNSYTSFRQYAVEEAGGIYFLTGSKLMFMNESDGALVTVDDFGTVKDYYEYDGILYAAYQSQVYRYDLKNKKELSSISLEGMTDILAIGVDHQGRYYASQSTDNGYSLSLFDADGKLLSATTVSKKIYSFSGFDSVNGNFYMESSANYYSWGMDHYGHGLTMGNVANDKISFIDTTYSFLESGMVSRSVDCIEYLCQNYAYYHQVSAQFLDDQYLVTTSNLFNRVRLMDSNNSSALWSLERELDESTIENAYYDTNSVGVRALLIKNHNSVLIADNATALHEYDLETGEELYSYDTSYPVFSLQSMGDYAIAIEKSGSSFYLEKIDISDPEQVEITGNQTMKVGESQHLSVNMGYRSFTSSDSSVVSVDSEGNAAAWKAGNVVITVKTADGRSTNFGIQVEANTAGDVTEATHKTSGTVSDNISDNNYTVWSKPVNSYVIENEDGSYSRIEYIADTGVVIENYDTDWTCKSTKTISMELPIFGGFYSGSDANYIVYGQKNSAEDDTVEILRVVKYSKEWTRISALSVNGANTYIPFDAGSLRMTETAGKLYIHTCHEMYADSGSTVHHQANMTYVVSESDMSLQDSYYDVMNIAQAGYVSHSFNQFIQTDGSYVYRVDHGDANPRAVAITRCDVDGEITDVNYIYAYNINGNSGVNSTGVSVGGFELSTSGCLIAGNSVDMTDSDTYSAYGKRNIFITVTDKKLTKTSTKWFTDYDSSSNVTVRTPQLVKLSSEQFLLMWEEYDSDSKVVTTRFVTVDGQGNKMAEYASTRLRLSDCQPILTGKGHVVWYVTDGSSVKFYQLNPYDLSQGTSVDLSKCDITLSQGSETGSTLSVSYTGSEIAPDVIVKDDDKTLTKDTEYEVSYENNINAGTATVIVTGKGDYKGTVRKTFTITKVSQTITATPSAINIVEGGTGTVTVTGIGNITVSCENTDVLSVNVQESLDNRTTFNYKGLMTGTTQVNINAAGDQNHEAATVTIAATVAAKAAQSISTTLDTISVIQGKEGTLTATGIGDISFSVADESILSMTQKSAASGSATFSYKGLSLGTTTVRISASGDENHEAAYKDIPVNVVLATTDISTADVSLSQNSYEYDGSEKKPEVTVTYSGANLTKDKDYRLSYNDCIDAGTAKVVVEGIGEYSGTAEKTYAISSRSIDHVQLVFSKIGSIDSNEVYDLWEIVDGDHILTHGKDYSCGNEVYCSTPGGDLTYLEVNFYGIGNYTGSKKSRIYPISSVATLYSAKSGPSGTTLTWKQETGAAGYHIYRVKGNETKLVATIQMNSITSWTDAEVTDPNAGYQYYIETYTLSSDGIVSSSPSSYVKTETFSKNNSISAEDKTVTCCSYSRKMSLSATCYGGAALSYSSNNSALSVNSSGIVTIPAGYVGSAVITITSAATSDYNAATRQVTVTVLPGTTRLTSAVNVKGKKMTVKWKKYKAGSGYQIQYALNSSYTVGVKTVLVKKNTKASQTIKKLKKGKKYYVRIRTYKTVGGKNYFSGWSNTKAVKIKK